MKKRKKDSIQFELITGGILTGNIDNIAGYCKYNLHRGYVTFKQLREHGCIEKACPYYERREKNIRWRNLKIFDEKIKKREAEKFAEKLHKKEKEEKISDIKNKSEEIAKQQGYNIVITSVVNTSEDNYTIFYVSEYRQDDCENFSYIVSELYRLYGIHSLLSHIKNVNGDFATINDWNTKSNKNYSKHIID